VVHGTVTTKPVRQFPGVQVTLAGTTTIVVSGADGSYNLGGLPAGTHELVARKISDSRGPFRVTLSPRSQSSVNLVLDEAQVLKTIRVTGVLDDGLSRNGFLARKQTRPRLVSHARTDRYEESADHDGSLSHCERLFA